MEKIKSFINPINEEHVEYYQLTRKYSQEDIQKIVESLIANKVEIGRSRLSNSLEQPDHFFRVFPTLKDLYTYPIDDIYIDDMGVDCIINGIKVEFTFDFAENQVITTTKEKIDLEDLLMQLEK